MFGSNRLYIIAVGGWLVAAFLLCPAVLNAQDTSKEQPSSAAATDAKAGTGEDNTAPQEALPIEVPLPNQVIDASRTNPSSAEDSAKDAKRKEERAEADLNAQQDMADWAFGTLIATWASVCVASFAVVLVYITLRDTRRSDERQLRAYLVPFGATLETLEDGTIWGKAQGENVGQTPANNVKIWAAITILKFPEAGHIVVVRPSILSRAVSPPRRVVTIDLKRTAVSADDKAAIINKSKAIYVSGVLEYEDVFQRKWRKEFRFMHCGSWEPSISMAFAPEGNDPEHEVKD